MALIDFKLPVLMFVHKASADGTGRFASLDEFVRKLPTFSHLSSRPPESNLEPMKGSFFEVARYDRSSKSFLGFELLAEKDWKKPKITSVSSYHLVTIQALSWLFSQIYGTSQTSQSVHRKHLKQFNLLTKCSGNS